MASGFEALGGLYVAIACGVVLGIAVLLIIYKMIDRDLPVPAGLVALVVVLVSMAYAIRPTHPAVPAVVLVLAMTLMAFFPFAARILEDFEMRRVDAERLSRTYEAIRARPDNFAAKFEMARLLRAHGFGSQAVYLASSTLESLATERDEIQNRSLREVFHREEVLIRRWRTEPMTESPLTCPTCAIPNRPSELFCVSCGEPYLLRIVESTQFRPRVWAKLVLAWSATAAFVPLSVVIGLNYEGVLRFLMFGLGLALVGLLMAWLFRPPTYGTVRDLGS